MESPCCPRCAKAEGETCWRRGWKMETPCASGLQCRKVEKSLMNFPSWRDSFEMMICYKKDHCKPIKKKIAEYEEHLQDLLSNAVELVKDLTRMKKENYKCFSCSETKPENPKYPKPDSTEYPEYSGSGEYLVGPESTEAPIIRK